LRSIIALIFATIVMVSIQQFVIKPEQQKVEKKQAEIQQAELAAKQAAAAAVAASNAKFAPSAPVLAGMVRADSEKTTVVENDLYRITFSNRGGLVKSWILKKYTDDSGHPLELVNQEAAQRYGYPLALWSGDVQLRDKLNSVLYVPSETGTANAPNELSFEYADGDLAVKKSFSFDNTYVVSVKTSARRGGVDVTALPSWPAGFGDADGPPSYAEQHITYVTTPEPGARESVERLKLDKKGKEISGGRVQTGNYEWVGATDAYFGAIFLPEQPQNAAFAELRNAIEIPKTPGNPQSEKVKAEVLGVAAGALNATSSVRLFAGPKAVDVLESVHSANGVNIHGALDLGWFGFIGRPLFAWVRWTQRHWTSNWGWTIILVTVLINLALLPLRISQIKSSMKMQKVAPQMMAVKEKYKKYKLDDPRRTEMQKEIAALYKEHNVNPVGGCFPVLIQMPFLFAFYTMLKNVIELRHAGWLYLTDLSAPDPKHIIPIATVLLMVGLQRMMPATGMDKDQQRLMMFMTPVMFAMFTWSVASGLGLYIITGSVVQMVQQLVMNQTKMGREMRELEEKRALKAAEKRR